MRSFALVASLAVLVGACGSTAASGGVPTGGNTTDTASGADSKTGKPDDSKNQASVTTTPEKGGQPTKVEASKPASEGDATSKVLGAANAGSILHLFITEGGTVLTAYIDTSKHDVPGSVKVGAPASDAWVTLVTNGMVYNSKDSGTIEIDVCPTASGKALTGAFKNVVMPSEMPGMESVTLNGTFNLVFFGGAADLTCKAAPVQPDAGSTDTTTGKVDLGKFGKQEGSSCAFDPCAGGTDMTRQCCKYIPCIEPCMFACADKVDDCVMACMSTPMDPTCTTKCTSDMIACMGTCYDTCKVDAGCKTKFGDLASCEEKNASTCTAAGSEDAEQACYFDKCCTEYKAAF